MALGRTEPRRTHGTPPAVCPGLAAPATTEYDTATSTSVAHRARMGGADDAVRPGVKNGVVIDGSGMPRYRADVGVRHGRIVTIGRIRERAREVIDADGQGVAPGLVDGHTHM